MDNRIGLADQVLAFEATQVSLGITAGYAQKVNYLQDNLRGAGIVHLLNKAAQPWNVRVV